MGSLAHIPAATTGCLAAPGDFVSTPKITHRVQLYVALGAMCLPVLIYLLYLIDAFGCMRSSESDHAVV